MSSKKDRKHGPIQKAYRRARRAAALAYVAAKDRLGGSREMSLTMQTTPSGKGLFTPSDRKRMAEEENVRLTHPVIVDTTSVEVYGMKVQKKRRR